MNDDNIERATETTIQLGDKRVLIIHSPPISTTIYIDIKMNRVKSAHFSVIQLIAFEYQNKSPLILLTASFLGIRSEFGGSRTAFRSNTIQLLVF